MVNYGFELGLKELTDKDIKAVEKRLKDLDIQVGLNGQSLKSSIENALRGQQFKIDVVVDKANTTKLIQDAIAKAGINTNVSASSLIWPNSTSALVASLNMVCSATRCFWNSPPISII